MLQNYNKYQNNPNLKSADIRYSSIYLNLSGSDILRYIAINDLPINLRYIYKSFISSHLPTIQPDREEQF